MVVEIRIAVDGVLPPAKGEAKSMLAAGHVHAQRVRSLLEAAQAVMDGRELLAKPLRLAVVVRAPEGHSSTTRPTCSAASATSSRPAGPAPT